MKCKVFTILTLIIFLASCEEQFEWNRESSQLEMIAIEAVLTNENKNHLIKISQPYFEQNESPKAVTGALVSVRTNTGTVLATENPIGSGLYFTDSTTAVLERSIR